MLGLSLCNSCLHADGMINSTQSTLIKPLLSQLASTGHICKHNGECREQIPNFSGKNEFKKLRFVIDWFISVDSFHRAWSFLAMFRPGGPTVRKLKGKPCTYKLSRRRDHTLAISWHLSWSHGWWTPWYIYLISIRPGFEFDLFELVPGGQIDGQDFLSCWDIFCLDKL